MGGDLCIHPEKRVPSQRQEAYQRQKHIHELSGNTESSHHGTTPPWGTSLQALIIDKSWPHLNYTVHSSLWGKRDSAEIKSIILSSEDIYTEEQSWWAVLWSFWLKCCLRILLSPSNMKQSIRLWYIHVMKTFSYKICQSKTCNTFALKSPYREETWQVNPV